jgi:hypothetical protein
VDREHDKTQKVIYTAKAHITGDQGGDASRTDDGQPAIFLSVIETCRQQKEGQLAFFGI